MLVPLATCLLRRATSCQLHCAMSRSALHARTRWSGPCLVMLSVLLTSRPGHVLLCQRARASCFISCVTTPLPAVASSLMPIACYALHARASPLVPCRVMPCMVARARACHVWLRRACPYQLVRALPSVPCLPVKALSCQVLLRRCELAQNRPCHVLLCRARSCQPVRAMSGYAVHVRATHATVCYAVHTWPCPALCVMSCYAVLVMPARPGPRAAVPRMLVAARQSCLAMRRMLVLACS